MIKKAQKTWDSRNASAHVSTIFRLLFTYASCSFSFLSRSFFSARFIFFSRRCGVFICLFIEILRGFHFLCLLFHPFYKIRRSYMPMRNIKWNEIKKTLSPILEAENRYRKGKTVEHRYRILNAKPKNNFGLFDAFDV